MERHAETRQRSTLAAGLVLVLLSAPGLAQATAESRPATRAAEPVVDLPVSTTVKPVATTRKQDLIVVAVAHVDATDAPCEAHTAKKHCVDDDHWRIRLNRGSFRLNARGVNTFGTALKVITKRSPTDGLSEQTVVLRLDADSSCRFAHMVMQACAEAGLYKIEFEAKQALDGLVGRLPVWLPTVPPPSSREPGDEIRVILSWDSSMERLMMLVGNRPVEDDAAGWASASTLIGNQYAWFKGRGKSVPLMIDSGPTVPISRIIRAIDAARAACDSTIIFGVGHKPGTEPPATKPK